MGVDRPDLDVEDVEEPPPPKERTPPRDDPGAEGMPSRAESHRIAAGLAGKPADRPSTPATESADDTPTEPEPTSANGQAVTEGNDELTTGTDTPPEPDDTEDRQPDIPSAPVEPRDEKPPDDSAPAADDADSSGPGADRKAPAPETTTPPQPRDRDAAPALSDRNADLWESTADRETADTASESAETTQNASDKPVIGEDGSWGWKDVYLVSERNEAADAAYAERRAAEGRDEAGNYGEHGITPAMQRIEAELENGELVGCPEFSLKSPDRFKEKLAKRIERQPGRPVDEIARGIHDGIRYTLTFQPEHYTEGVNRAREKLESKGYQLVYQNPSWDDPDYKGVNSRWRDPESGQLFELQFHTPESWAAKQKTHSAYEKMADRTTSPEEVASLSDYQREIMSRLAVPPGALEIPYVDEEGR